MRVRVSDGRTKQPGGCPQNEQLVSNGRRVRPDAFARLNGHEDHDRSFGLLAARKHGRVQKSRLKLNR